MVRTQVQFEERQYERIRKLAHRKKISFAEAIRRLVRLGLRSGLDDEDSPRAEGLLKIVGVSKSGVRDLGRRHDHYLVKDSKK